MESLPILHKINVLIHVVAGTVALLTGLMALLVSKRKQIHKDIGRVFLLFLGVAIVTALFGVFIFSRNTFLLVITVLSGYLGYSGYRALQTKSNKPVLGDIITAVAALLSVLYFVYYFKSVGMIWNPVIIYSTVGYLVLVISYDFIRYLIPAAAYANLWLYEHILKMVSAFSGLLSAFSGTVFPQYHPYSQFLPSVLGGWVAIGFMISVYRKSRLKTVTK